MFGPYLLIYRRLKKEMVLMEDEEILEEGKSRNALQKDAMTAIYDALTYQAMGQPIPVEDIVSSLCELPYEECDYFVKAALIAAIKFQADIIPLFNAKMRKWTFDRLNRLEQAILLLAYVHYYYVEPGVDKGVVIDIAVKQSKSYLEEKDYKFVNAILDNVLESNAGKSE